VPPRTVVAIHQPNFLPWLGFFDKLARADVFVLLNSVQFPRTSKGTWINRVKLLVGGEARWATVPIVRPREAPSRSRTCASGPRRRGADRDADAAASAGAPTRLAAWRSPASAS
jgi:hypothetical protein